MFFDNLTSNVKVINGQGEKGNVMLKDFSQMIVVCKHVQNLFSYKGVMTNIVSFCELTIQIDAPFDGHKIDNS